MSVISAEESGLGSSVAPAARYSESGKEEPEPAEGGMRICLKPFLRRRRTFGGVMAIRRSLGYISLGIPIVKLEYGVPSSSGGGVLDEVEVDGWRALRRHWEVVKSRKGSVMMGDDGEEWDRDRFQLEPSETRIARP